MSTHRPLLTLLLATAVLLGPAPTAAADADDGTETARTSRPLAPGIRLESYDRLERDRWLRVDELAVDLGAPGVRAEYLGGDGPATVADAAARHPAGPGRRVAAAVNGDFFDIGATGAPLGPGVRGGRLLHAPAPGAGAAVGFGADGAGRVLTLGLDGSVTLPGGPRPLAGYNTARPPAEGYFAYTADWTWGPLPAPGPGPAAEADVRDGRVTAVRSPARGTPPAPGVTVLVGRGRAAARVAALRSGDPVSLSARLRGGDGGAPLVSALGGRAALVVAGVPQDHEGEPNDTAAPRTAVGLSRDGRALRVVTVDGRRRDSGGLTLTGLGRLMHGLGAHDALNLDGGGSTTLLAGRSGTTALDLENSPSDGSPRKVANGLVLTVPTGSGRAVGYRVEALGGATGVFPGLTRALTATGYDATLGPVAPGSAADGPQWSVDPGGSGRVDSGGVFHGVRPGSASVRARRAEAGGALHLDVLGPLTGIRPSTRRLGLADPAEKGAFGLTGLDAQGRAAPVEGRDVRWEYDRTRWRVGEDGRGGFTMTALVPRATGRIRATVAPPGAAAVTTELAVGVGLVEEGLADLSDAERWRGPGASAAPGHTGTGLRLTVTAGRGREPRPAPLRAAAAAAEPPRPVPLPDLARSLALWVEGDGSGGRVEARLRQGDGERVVLRGPVVDWKGWRRITLPVPALAERPLALDRLSASAGPRPGTLVLDTLTAQGPQAAAAPPVPVVRDPALAATPAEVRARPWRFALLAGGQSAADLRRAREEIRAERPELVLASGDAPSSSVHRGVRFLRLDGAHRTLDGGGLERLRALREGIAAAGREAATGALVVVQDDGAGPSAVDRKEAALRERLLAEFRRATGKGAAVVTLGGPVTGVGRAEGVLSVTAGRSGWVLVGTDGAAGGGGSVGREHEWVSVEPRPGPAPAPVAVVAPAPVAGQAAGIRGPRG
ncbi:phosphodiester glycosidase family protein [Streptomyces sp. NBC_00536]|uniref:phosphodiester glycosidase family protein n=1 Tax=Streptomyces sp. NBC_00536 TaxID=2975769 RepID=UPI002E81A1DF|nr:phosphodiester glycosidase family protein [Streptomyces sp. NBC_00536]WUC77565.1 phosphodiester glycosidase family protein [Streptomyces sp. NBC_00536]